VGDEDLGKGRLLVDYPEYGRLLKPRDRAGRECRGRRDPPRLPRKSPLTKELADTQ
jgi:hypothetical protein